MSKNVLYVAHKLTLGGANHSLLNILDNLPNNISPYVLIPKNLGVKKIFFKKYRGFDQENLKAELNKRNIKFYEAYYLQDNIEVKQCIFKTIFYSLVRRTEIKRISSIFKKQRLDKVHSNSSVTMFGADLAKILNIGHIFHIRENVEDMFKIVGKDLRLYLENIVSNAENVIFVSENLKKDFQTQLNKSNLKCSVKLKTIYNGIPLAKQKKCLKSNKEEFKIFCFGTIYDLKGQEDLIYLAKMLVDNKITNFKIFLVGYKKKDYFEYINNLSENLKVNDYISYLPYTKDIQLLRNEANIEIVCSRNEAFGRVAVEAMNFGNPVIVTNVGGLDEIVQHNVNGLKYIPGDINQLYINLINVMNDEINVAQLVNGGKKRSEEFQISKCVTKICELY